MEKDKEKKAKLGRTGIHIFAGIIILLLVVYYPETHWLLFYLLIISVILSFLSYFYKIPGINWLLDNFELEKHRKTFPGKSFIFFIAGSLLVIKLFPQNIALASIAILTFADPVSHFASKLGKIRYKKPFNENKTILSTILAIITAFIAASFFVPFKYAILAAIISMLSEALIIKIWEDYVDDNYLIPLAAGTAMFLAQKVF